MTNDSSGRSPLTEVSAGDVASLAPKFSRRFRIGVAVSVVWILSVGVLVWLKFDDSRSLLLNEWGDFFAGVFAPLAFLWLVLGYLQQGDELRLSADALRQQAQELKESVVQQQALVEVSREDLQSRRNAAQPHFRIEPGGSVTVGGMRSYRFKLRNYGAAVSKVEIRGTDQTGQLISSGEIPVFDGRGGKEFGLEIPRSANNAKVRVDISYLDLMGNPGQAVLRGGFDEDDEHSAVTFP